MSGNLQLFLRITADGSGLVRTMTAARTSVRQFSTAATGYFSGAARGMARLNAQLNGFSTAARLVAGYFGVQALRSIEQANLAFERTMLQLKWNAQMTKAEMADIRKMSIDMARDTLNTPQQMGNMFFRLGNAGLKMESIKKIGAQVAPTAPVFGADPDALADLAFDLVTKFNIKEERLGNMLNMLYYHGTSGRFETSAMAREAPRLLNAGANVGITGEEGTNLVGAITQRMMRRAVVTEPGMVSTLLEEGMSHLTAPLYKKGLATFGINVESFFDKKGHFKGEGGVEGVLRLTRAMKMAGLDNPFNLGKAGFREKETRNFWLEMMASLDADDSDKNPNLIKMLERGRKEKESGETLANNAKELKNSAVGKAMAAGIEAQKTQLSGPGAGATDWYESAKLWAMDHKGVAAAGATGLLMAGRLGWKAWQGRGGGLAGAAGALGGGTQPVFITNWPGGLLSPKEVLGQKRNGLPGAGGVAPVPGTAPSRLAQFAAGAKGTLKFAAPLAALLGLAEAGMTATNDSLTAEQKKAAYVATAGGTAGSIAGAGLGGAIGALFGGVGAVPGALIGGALGNLVGEGIANWMAKDRSVMDNYKPQEQTINLVVDSQVLASVVNKSNVEKARRN